jgi:hypothetical protein
MKAEAVRVVRADPPEPNLSAGDAADKAIRRGQFVGVDFVVSCFDVDRHELAFVAWFQ